MKKLIILIVVSICLFGLIGYAYSMSDTPDEENPSEQTTVYSFTGSNELFEISNGVIVLGAEEVFDGGDLRVIQTELFSDVTSYSTAYYLMKNGEKRTILTHGVEDTTGGFVNIAGGLGRISGDGVIIGNNVENVDGVIQSLWFELRTTDVDGRNSVYTLELNPTEITH